MMTSVVANEFTPSVVVGPQPSLHMLCYHSLGVKGRSRGSTEREVFNDPIIPADTPPLPVLPVSGFHGN
jgi:hypothetical protein